MKRTVDGETIIVDDLIRRMDLVSLHRRQTRDYKRITPNEEKTFSKILRNGHSPEDKKETRDQFVLGNIGLVQDVAKREHRLEYLDAVQFGYVWLLENAHRYRWEKGPFSTWATTGIRRAIQREGEWGGRTARIPSHVAKILPFVSMVESRLRGELGREPTPEEFCVDLNREFRKNKIDRRGRKITPNNVARWRVLLDYEEEIGVDVPDVSLNTEEKVARNIGLEFVREVINDGVLKQQERIVITKRHDFMTGETTAFQKIGDEIGCSGEGARQIYLCAQEKMRGDERIINAYELLNN